MSSSKAGKLRHFEFWGVSIPLKRGYSASGVTKTIGLVDSVDE